MKNLYRKLLRSNRRDYELVIFVGVITVSLIYFTIALTSYLYQIVEGEIGTATEIYGQLGIFIITYILMIVLLILVVLEYIRKRMYTYSVLTVLGIQKKQRNRLILWEYVGIVVSSMLGGVLLGICLTEVMKKVLINVLLNGDKAVSLERSLVPIRLTLIISIVVFVVLFLIGDQLIACLGIDTLINPRKHTTAKLLNRKLLLIPATIFEIIAITSYFGYWGMLNKLFPIIIGSIGLYFWMQYIGEVLRKKARNNKRKYYKNITWLNKWHEQLHYYLNQAYLITVLLMVVIAVLGVSFLDHYPANVNENYLYDIVWMAEKKDETFINSIEDKYACTIQKRDCIRVTTPDFGEHVGISASEYQKWTGQTKELLGEEIFIVYQRERKQRNELGIDYGRKKPRVHIGNATYDLWLWDAPHIMPSNKFDTSYHVKGEEDRILTGVFESSAIGRTKTNVWENVIVFSDDYYEKVKDEASGANLIVMIEVSGQQYDMLLGEIKEYAHEHSQADLFSPQENNLIYEKDTVIKEKQRDNFIQLISTIINSGILLFCMLFMLIIKTKNDSTELCERYRFYYKMGMEKGRRKKNIYKENFLFMNTLLLYGGIVGGVFATIEIIRKDFNIEWLLVYMMGITAICVIIVILFVIATWILARQEILKVERGNQNV